MSDWFLNFAEILVLIFLGLLCFKQLKQVFLSYSGSVGKATDDGETLNMNVNFMAWDTEKSMKKKLALLNKLGDDRKQFHIDRYHAIMKKAAEDKAEEVKRLKSV